MLGDARKGTTTFDAQTPSMGRVKEETWKGAKWGIIQKCTMQPVLFLYSIILARLISPEEMGILGLTSIFFAVASQLKDCGFGAALIRKQERTETDCSTIFWYNMAMSFVMSALLIAGAPWLASFYHQPALTNLTRVSAVMMFLGSSASVHSALFSARRDFKTPAIINMCCTLVALPWTIWAAFDGWSYWAPVTQGVISGLLSLTAIWIWSPWKPQFIFSWNSFREFFGFGSKLMMSGMVTTLYDQSRTFVIGKFYSPAALANYTRGFHLCDIPIGLIQSTLGNVTYPILSTLQKEEDKLLQVYRQYIRLIGVSVSWCMLTIAALSRPLVLTLYGSKWETCAIYAQVLCLGIMFNPLSTINSSILMVKGRSDLLLRREIIMRIFGLPAMAVGACFSVMGVCCAAVASGCFACIVSVWMVGRVVPLTWREQVADFGPYLSMAAIANVPGLLLSRYEWPPLVLLILGGSISLGLYLGMLYLRQDTAGAQLWRLAQERLPWLRRFCS